MGVTACHVCSTGSSPQARSTLTCLIQEQLLRVRDLSIAAAAISKSNQSPKSVPVGMQPGPVQPHPRAMSAAVRTSLRIPPCGPQPAAPKPIGGAGSVYAFSD